MRRDGERTFHRHDAFLGAWCPRTDKSDEVVGGDWHTFQALRRLMRREGFTFHVDPEVRLRYPSIARGHYSGRRRDVLFKAEIFPAGFRIQFYEDVVRDHPSGGFYTYDKMLKAPYLWRLRVELIHRKIAGLLVARGFRDVTDPVPRDAMDKVRLRRAEHEAFHGPGAYSRERPRYNVEDQDDREIKDGDLRWFYDHNGRLMRGECWHNINNMWWVVVDRFEVRNMAAYELFTYDPAKHPRKWSPHPIQNLSRRLEKTVKARDYRRAAVMSEALARMVDSFDFKQGDRVVVQNTRYNGPGVVDYIDPPFKVGVKLPNGNTWSYEWATVRPATEPAQV